MNHKRLLPQMIGLILIFLLLASCGTPQPTPTLTPVPPTPTATSTPEGSSWDYVALGDSEVTMPVSYVNPYAAYIEDNLGVKVRLDKWGFPGMKSDQLLDRLRNNQLLRDALGEAEVVTLVIGYNDVALQLGPYKRGDCGGEDNRDCIRDALKSFRVNYDAIIAELFTLCSSKTIIRT